MRTILVTGGCGFIGHRVVKYILDHSADKVIIMDKLSYASKDYRRLSEVGVYPHPRVEVYPCDLAIPLEDMEALQEVSWVIHLAAETHVDKSIREPVQCIQNNVMSTVCLLELARRLPHLEKFLYFSTDEVYGPALDGRMFGEGDRHRPTNPYSASKSASEAVCLAYENTYKIPLVICNCMNVLGERQHVEKFLPICIKSILENQPITIHSYPGCDRAGSRFYIYVENVASAIWFLMENGKLGETYHIPGQKELSNDELVRIVARKMGVEEPRLEFVDFHSSRPGHDLRYGLDGGKLLELGWTWEGEIERVVEEVVDWYLENRGWLE